MNRIKDYEEYNKFLDFIGRNLDKPEKLRGVSYMDYEIDYDYKTEVNNESE